MEFTNTNYGIGRMSNNYNLNNYRAVYNQISSGERNYINCIKYAPKTTNTGNYLPLK